MKPNLKLILDYKHFFKTDPPLNRLEIIKNIPKINLLFEIAGLNYRLKPNDSLKYDTSLETQKAELRYFCPKDDNLYRHYVAIASSHTKSKEDYPLIFNRCSNLFALEEIMNCSDFVENDEFDMRKVEVWDAIFKYLLAVNTEITKIKPIDPKNLTIENISASSIILNELMIEDNPFFTIYRGLKLIEYLSNHSRYSREIEIYFDEVLKIEKDRFIYNLLSLIVANQKKEKYTEFVYNIVEKDGFLDYLSKNRIANNNPMTLLSIKKTPFYKVNDSQYIVLDINFLINKGYNFFINDFWFDYLKPQIDKNGKEIFKFKDYRGVFGLFFESYIKDIIENSFNFLKYPSPLLFDDLKILTSGGHIEIADIYVRQNKKILVGQVKSGSIYENEKFSGEINILYKNDRENFFNDFGVNQTLNSIKNILKHSKSFDPNLQVNKRIEFYPIVVVNDKIFQTPLVPNLFHMRFHELLLNNNFGQHIIHPLTVIHVSDLEYLENGLSRKDIIIWDILQAHYNRTSNTIMPPFINTVDRFIGPHSITERSMAPIRTIIKKYSVN